MPCMDGGRGYDESLHERLHAATRAACELAEALKSNGESDYNSRNYFIRDLSKETRNWIKDHEKADRERVQREKENHYKKKLKKKALAKLTKEERKALNL